MERLDDYMAAKRHVAATYTEALIGMPGVTPVCEAPWACGIFWMYTVLIDEARSGMSSRALLSRLAEAGIQTRPLWQSMHQSPAYADLKPGDCVVANRLYRDALSLPCSVGLQAGEQEHVVRALHRDH